MEIFFENLSPIVIPESYGQWLQQAILDEGKKPGNLSFIFSDDAYLLTVNQDYLNHDYLTDIITFDYVKGKHISGDIFISLQRIQENSQTHKTDFLSELRRVMVHGILHLCGYKDKSALEQTQMREKENHYLDLFSHQFEI